MKTRILGQGASCYHVFSRINERRFLLHEDAKNVFRDMMWRAVEFSGVHILTYCIMDNHFHLLIEVPERVDIDDGEILRRITLLYIGIARENALQEWQNSFSSISWHDTLRKKYLRRMYDLSEFMRTLKLRFSFWFNKNNDREGTLWDARFKSVLIQGRSHDSSGNLALVTVAAYIDLNPLRANIVDDPATYSWCGFGEAISNSISAKHGVFRLYSAPPDGESWDSVLATYYSVLTEHGGIGKTSSDSSAYMRFRIRTFTRGNVLGDRFFVENTFNANRRFFSANRKMGARKLHGIPCEGLFAVRDIAN